MSLKKQTALWTERYRPTTFDDYVFHDEGQRTMLMEMVENGSIPHLLLSGYQGSGKTTLSGVLINALKINDEDVLRINCSDEKIDALRDKVKSFAATYCFSPHGFKVVQLEEFDWLGQAGFGLLRDLMEAYSDNCRFIATCNYENKVIGPIKSRMTHLRFKAPERENVLLRCGEILAMEEIEFTLEDLEKYVAIAYPDMRKIIGMLQANAINGVLRPPVGIENGDWRFKLLDIMAANDLKAIRKLVCEEAAKEDFEEIYTFLYQNITKIPKYAKNPEGAIVTLAAYMYKHSMVVDPELNFAAMMIELDRE